MNETPMLFPIPPSEFWKQIRIIIEEVVTEKLNQPTWEIWFGLWITISGLPLYNSIVPVIHSLYHTTASFHSMCPLLIALGGFNFLTQYFSTLKRPLFLQGPF